MQKITLKQLEMFVAVAECSSFTLAAERLYTTQSTVSMQIAALEKKMKSEKQLNRRMEINAELKRLRRGL